MPEYRRPGYCMICRPHLPIPVRYIDLYVLGSEGLTLCHTCEMKLVEYAQALIGARLLEMKQQFLAKRIENERGG